MSRIARALNSRVRRLGTNLCRLGRYSAAALNCHLGPSFLIIGGQKCGTTSLHKYLMAHPRLLGVAEKEINFFDQNINYERGRAWYMSHFPVPVPSSQPGLPFEATPEYLYYPQAAARIREMNQDIKLIVLLRDPVERAYSAWNMMFQRSRNGFRVEPGTYDPATENALNAFHSVKPFPAFDECVREEIAAIEKPNGALEPGLVRRGIYVDQLQRYFQVFDRKQILILDFRLLKGDPAEILRRIGDFLGLPAYDWGTDFPIYLNGDYDRAIPESSRTLLSTFYAPYNQKLYTAVGQDFGWC